MTIRPLFHRTPPPPRRCRGCGCDDTHACVTPAGPCHWVSPDRCSACAHIMPDMSVAEVSEVHLNVTGTVTTPSGTMTASLLKTSPGSISLLVHDPDTDPETGTWEWWFWDWHPVTGDGWDRVPTALQPIITQHLGLDYRGRPHPPCRPRA